MPTMCQTPFQVLNKNSRTRGRKIRQSTHVRKWYVGLTSSTGSLSWGKGKGARLGSEDERDKPGGLDELKTGCVGLMRWLTVKAPHA